MEVSALKKMIDKRPASEGVPKGAFCRADLEAQGMTQTQGSAIIKSLLTSKKIEFAGKFKTKKVTGDWNQTPFYKVKK